MVLAVIWLIIWDYDRFRGLIFKRNLEFWGNHSKDVTLGPAIHPLPQLTLENSYERTVYITGTVAGILFFGMTRGQILPAGFELVLLSVCLICFIIATVFAFRNAKAKR